MDNGLIYGAVSVRQVFAALPGPSVTNKKCMEQFVKLIQRSYRLNVAGQI
ncbi:MAG TPA: hypothetical protein VH796_18110 [Nitrososphaeraceae archaeon]